MVETMLLLSAAAGFELGPSFAFLSDNAMLLLRGEVQGGSDGIQTMLLVFAAADTMLLVFAAAAVGFELGPSTMLLVFAAAAAAGFELGPLFA